MHRLSARKLLSVSPQDLWDLLTGEFILVFDDGELQTNYTETIFSRYFWRYHLEYPNLKLSVKHHVTTILKNDLYNAKTHISLLNNILWDAYDSIPNANKKDLERLSLIDFEITNELYNDTVCDKIQKYAGMSSILDYIALLDDPIIKAAHEKLTPDPISISQTQKIVAARLIDPDIGNNSVMLAVRMGVVRLSQMILMVGPRGYPTDMDGLIFRHPILTGYIHGFRKFYDIFTDSRGGAMALAYANSAISQTEYFNRKAQLNGQQVERVHQGDCGSKETHSWLVTKDNYNNLIGKYYYNENNELCKITNDSKHLINKTINLRVIYKCNHPDPNGVCSTCLGELAISYLTNTNPGQSADAIVGEKITSSLLQAKHEIGSAEVNRIELDHDASKLFEVSNDGIGYKLNKLIKGKYVCILVSSKEAPGIPDVKLAQDVLDLSLFKVSRITEIGMTVNSVEYFVPVVFENRKAYFTHAFLDHVKKYGYSTTSNGDYLVDMEHWDFDRKVMELPMKHYNMSDHASLISSHIESSVSNLAKRNSRAAIDNVMEELYTVVNAKIPVHFSVLEIVFFSTTIQSAGFDSPKNFSLPKLNTPAAIGALSETIRMRSMSAALVYQGQHATLTRLESTLITNRPDHPLDVLFNPQELSEYYGW